LTWNDALSGVSDVDASVMLRLCSGCSQSQSSTASQGASPAVTQAEGTRSPG
jgi:hypothetical protein